MKRHYQGYLIIFTLYSLIASCSKEWLNEKPDLSLAIPTKISDYQAILDNTSNESKYNIPFNNYQSSLDEVFVGDYNLDDAMLQSITVTERSAYMWEKNVFASSTNSAEWDWPYRRILSTNVIMEGLSAIKPKNSNEQSEWNNVMGAALFFRASSHYNIAQLFSPPYDSKNSMNTLGIPLRLKSELLEKSVRATTEQVYNQITGDLLASVDYLPVSKPSNNVYKMRPTKAAAHGMLARIYLSMEKYDSALIHSEACLQLHDDLMNFATDCDTLSMFTPILQFNSEVIFYNLLNNYSALSPLQTTVAPSLFEMYNDDNDLRRKTFFDYIIGTEPSYKGSYWGFILPYFSGLATDEIYLIKAECLARKGMIEDAMKCLNQLLITRWRPGTYVEMTAQNPNDALDKILAERRKELCFRGLRWADLRRLNKDQRLATTLKRTINGVEYSLPPNDLRYVFLIPSSVIEMSGIQQNPR